MIHTTDQFKLFNLVDRKSRRSSSEEIIKKRSLFATKNSLVLIAAMPNNLDC